MADDLQFAHDVLRMVRHGIAYGHIKARDVEFLYDDGPKRVSVHELAGDAMRAIERETAARAAAVPAAGVRVNPPIPTNPKPIDQVPAARTRPPAPPRPPAADVVRLVDALIEWAQSAALAPSHGGPGDEAAHQAELDAARAQLLAAVGVTAGAPPSLTDAQIEAFLPKVRHRPGMVGATLYAFGDVAAAVRAALGVALPDGAQR